MYNKYIYLYVLFFFLLNQLQDKETDYDEMEQWLKQHEEATGAGKPEEPISSSG